MKLKIAKSNIVEVQVGTYQQDNCGTKFAHSCKKSHSLSSINFAQHRHSHQSPIIYISSLKLQLQDQNKYCLKSDI